ncbi:MAG: LppX_LprAFG lipoprotein [Anaerolineae bacterium]|nr:LppX_LprAFG lipoprotein [Anaerolineae bacterium]
MKPERVLILLIGLGFLLTACLIGDDDENNGDAPPDPAALMATAAQEIDDTASFELLLAIEGAPILLDVSSVGFEEPLTLERAEAAFEKPDRVRATVRIGIEDVVTDMELIAIGEEQYIRHPLITFNRWMNATVVQGFQPSALVSEEQGIAHALRSVENVRYVGEEDLDGVTVHHLQGEVDAAEVQAVTFGLITSTTGVLQADVFIRTRDGRLEQLLLVEPDADPASSTTWTIGLYGYGGDFGISAPEVE